MLFANDLILYILLVRGVDKSCGSKRNKKGVSVNPSTQNPINEKHQRDAPIVGVSFIPSTQYSINEKTPKDVSIVVLYNVKFGLF